MKKITMIIEDDENGKQEAQITYPEIKPWEPWAPSYPFNMPIMPYSDPCVGCPNNPRNNPYATGTCVCSLPNRVTYC